MTYFPSPSAGSKLPKAWLCAVSSCPVSPAARITLGPGGLVVDAAARIPRSRSSDGACSRSLHAHPAVLSLADPEPAPLSAFAELQGFQMAGRNRSRALAGRQAIATSFHPALERGDTI